MRWYENARDRTKVPADVGHPRSGRGVDPDRRVRSPMAGPSGRPCEQRHLHRDATVYVTPYRGRVLGWPGAAPSDRAHSGARAADRVSRLPTARCASHG